MSVTGNTESRSTPQIFNTCSYNHARRLRLEKLLHIGLSKSPSGYFKLLLDPGGRCGGLRSEMAVTYLLQKQGNGYTFVVVVLCNGNYPTDNGRGRWPEATVLFRCHIFTCFYLSSLNIKFLPMGRSVF
jgi:hypothetical protein